MNEKQKENLKRSIGKSVIISVGINKYASKEFPDLSKSCNDAAAMFETFKNISNLDMDQKRSILLTSNTTNVTKINILEALHTICEQVNFDEKLIFYYSGHGHRIGEANYIVPFGLIDAEHENLINIEELINIIEQSNAKHKLIILDSCFSGMIENGAKSISEYNYKNINDYISKSKSLSIITSSGKDEPSFEKSPSTNYSLFTSYVLHALEGKPEALDGIYLTVNSLFKYVSENVRKVCRGDTQINQRPTCLIISNGEVVLGMYDQIGFSDEYDIDNTCEISIDNEMDLFNYLERKTEVRISDDIWFDTKRFLSELILNCFEHEQSKDVRIILGSKTITLRSKANKFDSISASSLQLRQSKGKGLRIVNQFLNQYKDNIVVEYSYLNGENQIELTFNQSIVFKIEGLCEIQVYGAGFRRYTSKDIKMPIGKCKKYYYYIADDPCISIVSSAVEAILETIPHDSKLIVIDVNSIRGRIRVDDYIAHPRLIYRTVGN